MRYIATRTYEISTSGPAVQCSELAADNRLVGSSSPPSPTTRSYENGRFPRWFQIGPIGGRRGLGDGLILLAAAAADADRANDLAIDRQLHAAGENHDPVVVRRIDAEELVARLAVLVQSVRPSFAVFVSDT